MSPAILKDPAFSEAEWEIVLELLERESALLLREIRRTDTGKMRDLLRRRSTLVDALLARLRSRDLLGT
jgi:hypothetical protein